jgi:hypothetical protein
MSFLRFFSILVSRTIASKRRVVKERARGVAASRRRHSSGSHTVILHNHVIQYRRIMVALARINATAHALAGRKNVSLNSRSSG